MPPTPGRYRTGEFLGLTSPFCDPEIARFVVIPIPYEKTTVSGKGTAGGPRAILEASRQVELFDEETFREWYRVGVTTRFEVACDDPPDKLADLVEPMAAEIMLKGKRPIFLGGERSICLGPIRAASGRHADLTVLHLSAKADLKESQGDRRFAEASIMRRVVERCPVVQVGIRSLGVDEADQTDKGNVTTFFMHDIRAMNLKKELIPEITKGLGEHVYLSLDVGCFDPSLLPGTRSPEPGGLDWISVVEILRTVARDKNVVAMDLTGVIPLEGHFVSEFVSARLLYKLIGFVAQYHQLPEIPS